MVPDRYIHEKAQIADSCILGHFVTVGQNSRIGERTSLGNHVCLANNVIIGDDCVICDRVTICENVEIGNSSFIDTDVVFTQQLYPKSNGHVNLRKTHVGNGVCIHAKSVIESGCFIEDNSVIERGTSLNALCEPCRQLCHHTLAGDLP